MIDTHCHILPGVDDGAKTMEESLEMLQMAYNDGITDIVATPHLSSTYMQSIEKIHNIVDELRQQAKNRNINIKIHYGFEVRMCLEIFNGFPTDLTPLTINGKGKYILLEPPFLDYPLFIDDIIDRVISEHIIPIVVHPLRNTRIISNLSILDKLKSKGVIFQFDKNAVMDGYQIKTSHIFFSLLKKGLVDLVASDGHSCDIRKPTLSNPYNRVAKAVGEDAAQLLFTENPRRILKGEATDELHLISNTFFDRVKHIFNF